MPKTIKAKVTVIPADRWTPAMVRRLKSGKVEVKLQGWKYRYEGTPPVARPKGSHNPKPLRVIKVTPPYDWGAGKGGKSWIIVDSEGKQVSGFYKTKKIAESFRRKY